ncbi:MAG TPA: metallophosphoesterase [Acidobacteriota bacterium]|nr:metallophosphoesterase [Acidobacteriota bacterium]
MKPGSVIILISTFFLITGLISSYIFIRGWQSIPPGSSLRHAFAIVFWIIAFSFLFGRLMESYLPSALSHLFVWMGSFWIAAMIYFLIAVVCCDSLRIVNHFLPFFPSAITRNYTQAKYITAACVTGLVGLVLLAGHINSLMPRIRNLDLSIAKQAGTMKCLNIVAVSDIHLGTIVGRSRIDQIVERINRLNPDVVLLVGDIVDEDLAPVIRQNLGESLRNIKAPLGIFAVTGNHEYIGGVERACKYLTEHNIVMLRDRSIKVNDAFYLVGREDRMIGRRTDHLRKALPELMATVDKKYPVILMDHQPFGLNDAVAAGVDLQISGHTHDGQLWPVNFIVDRIYELPWGYRKIGGTHFYVSDGVGTWGPPVRIGNRPEIVNIRLNFQ